MFRTISKQSPLKLPPAKIVGIVLHWSAGKYGQHFPDYHFSVDWNGDVLQNDGALPGETLSHTWHRNTGRIGISAAAMWNATEDNYGVYPITKKQIEAMAALSAKLMKHYKIPIEEVKTHAEWATIDGYGPGSGEAQTRWDLWHEGKDLKKKILWYLDKLKSPSPRKGAY